MCPLLVHGLPRDGEQTPASLHQGGNVEMDLISDRRMGRTGETHTSTASPNGRSLAVLGASHRDSGVCKHGLVDELESSVELVPTLSLSLHTHTCAHTHMHTHTHT